MRQILFSLLLIFIGEPLIAQNSGAGDPNKMKGKFYFYWGYNRETYTKSNIRFKGDNFDFTVKKAVALDRQSPLALDPYLKIDQITIPQYNYRFGYYINDKYNISLGWDHMKYVMIQDQVVKVSGVIKNTGTDYDRTYDNEDVKLTGDFLQFEHTDGLNYLNAEVNRVDPLYNYKKLYIKSTYGLAAGILCPRTRAVVLNNNVNDQWHISGFGISAKTGINMSINNHFFIQAELKAGFIDMPSIVIKAHSNDRAKQNFGFVQGNIVFGYQFNLNKK
jgi:hypothetical protein